MPMTFIPVGVLKNEQIFVIFRNCRRKLLKKYTNQCSRLNVIWCVYVGSMTLSSEYLHTLFLMHKGEGKEEEELVAIYL